MLCINRHCITFWGVRRVGMCVDGGSLFGDVESVRVTFFGQSCRVCPADYVDWKRSMLEAQNTMRACTLTSLHIAFHTPRETRLSKNDRFNTLDSELGGSYVPLLNQITTYSAS